MDSYTACLIYDTLVVGFIALLAVALNIAEVFLAPVNERYQRAVLDIVGTYAAGDERGGERLVAQAARMFWRPRRLVMEDVEDVACFGKDVARLSVGPV